MVGVGKGGKVGGGRSERVGGERVGGERSERVGGESSG